MFHKYIYIYIQRGDIVPYSNFYLYCWHKEIAYYIRIKKRERICNWYLLYVSLRDFFFYLKFTELIKTYYWSFVLARRYSIIRIKERYAGDA